MIKSRKIPPLLIFVFFVFWSIALLYWSLKLLDLNSLLLIKESLITLGIWDLAVLVLIWIASYIVGLEILERIKALVDPGAERLAIASSLGLIFFSYSTLLLGIIGAFYQSICALLILLVILLGVRRVILFLNDLNSGIKVASENIPNILVFTYSAITLTVVLISALGPAIEYDDIFYHLYSGRMMRAAHRLVFLTDNPFTCMPRNMELLYAFGSILHNEVTAKLIHFLTGILCILLCYSLTKRIHSNLAGSLSVLILVGTPVYIWEMRTTHIDVGLTLFVFLAVYGIIRYFNQQKPSWLLLTGISLCFASGIKYLVFNAVGALSIMSIFAFYQKGQSFISALKKTLFLLVAVIVGLTPWMIINFKVMGDPLFPLLDWVFDSPHWNPQVMQTQLQSLAEIGKPVGTVNPIKHLFFLFGISSGSAEKFDGSIGPLYILIFPLILATQKLKVENKLLLLFFAIFSVLWIATAQSTRYFLSAVPPLAVICACSLAEWFQISTKNNRAIAYSSFVIVGLVTIYSTPLFENVGSGARYGAKIINTLPTSVLAGQESKQDYIKRHVRNFEALHIFNQIKGRKKLLFGHNTLAASFYADVPSASVWSSYYHELQTDQLAKLLAALKRYGITHFLCDKTQRRFFLITDPEREFVKQHLIKLFEKNGALLYQISYQPVQQTQIFYYDFFENIDRAEYSLSPFQKRRNISELIQLVGSPGDKKYAIVLSQNEQLKFSLSVPASAYLEFYTGPDFCPAFKQHQITLHFNDGSQKVIFETKTNGREPYWQHHMINLSGYAGSNLKIVFEGKNLEASKCSDFIFADPELISSS